MSSKYWTLDFYLKFLQNQVKKINKIRLTFSFLFFGYKLRSRTFVDFILYANSRILPSVIFLPHVEIDTLNSELHS